MQRDISHTFYDIGLMLAEIRDATLYDAKGYANFESFLDRELPIGRVRSLALIRIVDVFKRDAALSIGLDALFGAMRALDDATTSRPARPLEPPAGAIGKASRR